jgi:hypothetical protein
MGLTAIVPGIGNALPGLHEGGQPCAVRSLSERFRVQTRILKFDSLTRQKEIECASSRKRS